MMQESDSTNGTTAGPERTDPPSIEELLYQAMGKAHVLALVFDKNEELHFSWNPDQQMMGLHTHCKDIISILENIKDALPGNAILTRVERREKE